MHVGQCSRVAPARMALAPAPHGSTRHFVAPKRLLHVTLPIPAKPTPSESGEQPAPCSGVLSTSGSRAMQTASKG